MAFPPNYIAVGPETIFCGDLVTGNLAAAYGGYVAAVLEAWGRADPSELALAQPGAPWRFGDFDWNDMTLAGLPQLGG